MRINRKSFQQKVDAQSWRDCLETARGLARHMEFEASISCCLEYLHRHPIPPGQSNINHIDNNRLKVVFACGGKSARWNNFLDIPKQMVDTGDGIPLIQRTINQLGSVLDNAEFLLVTSKGDRSFMSVKGAETIERHDSKDRPVLIEVLKYAKNNFDSTSNVLWIYGDSYFSDAATVTARKDDAPAAVQAAIVNVAGLRSSSVGGGLIQTTSG
jgi:hypothetical protein